MPDLKVLQIGEIEAASFELGVALTHFLLDVDASPEQSEEARAALAELISEATARQLRDLDEGD